MFSSKRNRTKPFGRHEKLEPRQVLSFTVSDVFYSPSFRKSDAFAVTQDSENNILEIDVSQTYGYVRLDHSGDEWVGPSNPGDVELLSVSAAVNGTVAINGEGQLVYTPNDDYLGTDNFTYTINQNGEEVEVNAEVFVVFPFVAVPDWQYVEQGSGESTVDVLANDVWNLPDIDGVPKSISESRPDLTITSITGCYHDGSLRIAEDGKSVIYTPEDDFVGLEEFTYTVVDEHGNERRAVGQIRVDVGAYDPDTATHFRYEDEFVHHRITRGLEDAWYALPRLWTSHLLYSPALDTLNRPANIGLRATDSTSAFFSDTNVQVAGVDEADLIENDGEYIYWLSTRDQDGDHLHELVVLNAQSPEEAGVLSSVRFESSPQAMFLHEGRLTVITSLDRQQVGVTVLDVSDPTAPTLVENNALGGSFRDARMVDGKLYLFVRPPSPQLHGFAFSLIDVEPYYLGDQGYTLQSALDRVRSELPGITSTTATGETTFESYVDVTTIRKDARTFDFLSSILVFDTTDELAGASSSVMLDFSPQTIYMDADSIHMTIPWTGREGDVWLNTQGNIRNSIPNYGTEIHSYSLSDDGLEIHFEATGVVDGHVTNQFSIDEHEGMLRVATNAPSWGFHSHSGSAVHVLELDGDSWKEVGSISGLAPGQRLYSARFMGDRAYLVTYEKVDPLHVIDLSDPTDPVELGELVIPGFSDYLHPISETLLIGLGRSASSDGLFRELQVSLFDVSDPEDPKRIHNYLIDGGRSTRFFGKYNPWGIGDLDHHAFSYFPESGILALPLHSQQTGRELPGVKPLYDEDESGIHLLKISAEHGIELVGEMEFDDRAERTLRIGDMIYGLSKTKVKGVHVDTPNEVVVDYDIQTETPALTIPVPVMSQEAESPSPCRREITETFNPEAKSVSESQLVGPFATAVLQPGDADANGGVDSDDIDYVFSMAGTTDDKADVNDDGEVNQADIDYIVEDVLETRVGDMDLDGEVRLSDFAVLASNYGETGGWADGDLDGDGEISFKDFALLATNFRAR